MPKSPQAPNGRSKEEAIPPRSSQATPELGTSRQFEGTRSPSLANKCYVATLVHLSDISLSGQPANLDGQVLFDSGANCCLTNRRDDFSSDFIQHSPTNTIDGIGKGLDVKGYGTMAWTFKSEDGMYRTLRLPCYYVPTVNHRIALLQCILEAYDDKVITMTRTSMILSGTDSVPPLSIPISPHHRLPIGETKPSGSGQGDAEPSGPSQDGDEPPATPQANSARRRRNRREKRPTLPGDGEAHPALTVQDNINLTEPEKELLRWHNRLGHGTCGTSNG